MQNCINREHYITTMEIALQTEKTGFYDNKTRKSIKQNSGCNYF